MTPKLSIGLPVHNSGRFLATALEALLSQTFDDFELVISDDASTDCTAEICASYARRDPRVRYQRNAQNLGSSRNCTIVFGQTRGQYFKWAAHDDVCLPDFLARCIEVLDADPGVVLCYTATDIIDETGVRLAHWSGDPGLAASDPIERLRACQLLAETIPIWGVMRREVLARTRLLGNRPGSDQPLLAELALHGRFYEVHDVFLLNRDHGQRPIRVYDPKYPHAVVWYDPSRAERIASPQWRLLGEYLRAIHRAPLNRSQRLGCYRVMLDWAYRYRREMWRDLGIAAERVPEIGAMVAAVSAKLDRLRRTARGLRRVIPSGARIVLVDDDALELESFAPWQVRPFLERDGRYWGRPRDGRHAIDELERMRSEGASFIVFAWPAFWWLAYYDDLTRHLGTHYPCRLAGDDVVVFDLRPPGAVER